MQNLKKLIKKPIKNKQKCGVTRGWRWDRTKRDDVEGYKLVMDSKKAVQINCTI